MTPNFEFQVADLIGSTPLFLVMLVGGMLCIARSWRHPRVCTLVGAAIAMELVSRFAVPFVMEFLHHYILNVFDGTFQAAVNGLLTSIPSAISWALMFYAIFGTGGAAGMKIMPWEEEP